MKYAFISTLHASGWGGSEELWGQAARRLKSQGHEVGVWVSYWMRDARQVKELEEAGVPIETHLPREPRRVRRIKDKLAFGGPRHFHSFEQFRPDLAIISQSHNDGGFEWADFCRKLHVPYALIVQCNSENWWFGERLDEAIESYSQAGRVFCVSHANLQLLQRQLGTALPNAEIVRNPFNVPGGEPPAWPDEKMVRVACVARLCVAAKGQDLLLEVLARPEWRERTMELNLYGSGPDEEALRRMAGILKLERVYFRGHVNDLRAVWAENHLLILPSRYEGLPLALVEAMWCSRPAVVTEVAGNTELCKDRETGFVAVAPTLNSVGEAMERAWNHRGEWEAMGRAARKAVQSVIPPDPIAVFCERLALIAAPLGIEPAPALGVVDL